MKWSESEWIYNINFEFILIYVFQEIDCNQSFILLRSKMKWSHPPLLHLYFKIYIVKFYQNFQNIQISEQTSKMRNLKSIIHIRSLTLLAISWTLNEFWNKLSVLIGFKFLIDIKQDFLRFINTRQHNKIILKTNRIIITRLVIRSTG